MAIRDDLGHVRSRHRIPIRYGPVGKGASRKRPRADYRQLARAAVSAVPTVNIPLDTFPSAPRQAKGAGERGHVCVLGKGRWHGPVSDRADGAKPALCDSVRAGCARVAIQSSIANPRCVNSALKRYEQEPVSRHRPAVCSLLVDRIDDSHAAAPIIARYNRHLTRPLRCRRLFCFFSFTDFAAAGESLPPCANHPRDRFHAFASRSNSSGLMR